MLPIHEKIEYIIDDLIVILGKKVKRKQVNIEVEEEESESDTDY